MTGNCQWCGIPVDGAKATCGSAHRGARFRYLKGIGEGEPPWAQSPLHGRGGEQAPRGPVTPGPDLALVRRLQRERDTAAGRADRALERAEKAEAVAARRDGSRTGHRARSGTMISYRKAVKAVRAALPDWYDPGAADLAERALREALAPTQRRKLEARDER